MHNNACRVRQWESNMILSDVYEEGFALNKRAEAGVGKCIHCAGEDNETLRVFLTLSSGLIMATSPHLHLYQDQ